MNLRRTPTDHPLRAVITSDQFYVCWTHFWGGRTVPCERPNCEACDKLSPARAHVYLSAYTIETNEHFIFECTTAAAEPFQAWIQTYGTLRGCLFQANRPKRRRNAPVQILTKPADQTKITLPKPPDIPLAMATIWQIPGAAVQSSPAGPEAQRLTTDAQELDRMRLNPADFAQATQRAKPNGRTS